MTIHFVKKPEFLLLFPHPSFILISGVQAMAILVVSDEMQKAVDAEVREGGYANAEDYLMHVIRKDQNDRAAMDLEAFVLEGMDSGDPVEMTPEKWEELRLEFHRLADSRR